MKITLRMRPHARKTEKYLEKLSRQDYFNILDSCARQGVEALRSATPKESGLTAASWTYEIVRGRGHTQIYWKNDNVIRDGRPIAILLQYGHGTGTGGYVVGRDYINPAIRPVFDDIANKVWEAMIKL